MVTTTDKTTVGSIDWLVQLRMATIEFCEQAGVPHSLGNKTYSRWRKDGGPIGLVMHYTAGPSWQGPLTHLSSARPKSRASCQFVVLSEVLEAARPIYESYPALSDLNVTVLMLSNMPLQPAWHAGWTNKRCVGIENRNCGLVKRRQGDGHWAWWGRRSHTSPLYTARYPVEVRGEPVMEAGRHWEDYPQEQIAANVVLGQHIDAAYRETGGLDPAWIIPHSACNNAKSDTGPCYPMARVRGCILSGLPYTLQGVVDDETSRLAADDDATVETRALECDASARDTDRVQLTPAQVSESLSAMGYAVGPEVILRHSVYIFQRSFGAALAADCIVGPKTSAAMRSRRAQLGV